MSGRGLVTLDKKRNKGRLGKKKKKKKKKKEEEEEQRLKKNP